MGRFVAKAVQDWIKAVGVKTAYIEPGSPWENGCCESFNARFRDEFLRILAHANGKGMLTHFSTNGTNFDRDFLQEYASMGGGQVTVSLDGATKKTHDFLRGYEGAFEIAMKAIETYRNAPHKNVTLKVQPVLTNENIHEIVGVFEIAKESNALFSVQAYDPMAFEVLRKEEPLSEIRKQYPFWVSEENFPLLEGTIESILELKRRHPGIILNTPEHLRDMVLYFERKLNFAGRCLVGYTSLFVVPDGNLTMCLYGDIGNLKDAPLKELWHSERFDKIREQMLACDRPCLNGCAQRYTTSKIVYEGYQYLKRRLRAGL